MALGPRQIALSVAELVHLRRLTELRLACALGCRTDRPSQVAAGATKLRVPSSALGRRGAELHRACPYCAATPPSYAPRWPRGLGRQVAASPRRC